jgi:bis(5'-nucleosyl)-tetraphosphatase (symmetrical)
MSTYAIGDLQGCYDELHDLLEKIQFDSAKDTLWFTGDLVNRGPKSLDCLRFVKSLGTQAITVLGNHDLHLLAMAYANRQPAISDTLSDILIAPDREELLNWLRQQPLLHYDPDLDFVLVHAGIAPQWTLATAQNLAHEVEAQLRSTDSEVLSHLYGNEPACWNEALTGAARWRCIINYFTRMRFCTSEGCLDLSYKGGIANAPPEVLPWFAMPTRKTQQRIIIGHWAALQGKTAMRLEDQKKFTVPARKKY